MLRKINRIAVDKRDKNVNITSEMLLQIVNKKFDEIYDYLDDIVNYVNNFSKGG